MISPEECVQLGKMCTGLPSVFLSASNSREPPLQRMQKLSTRWQHKHGDLCGVVKEGLIYPELLPRLLQRPFSLHKIIAFHVQTGIYFCLKYDQTYFAWAVSLDSYSRVRWLLGPIRLVLQVKIGPIGLHHSLLPCLRRWWQWWGWGSKIPHSIRVVYH